MSHIYESVGSMTLPIDPTLVDSDLSLDVLDPACAMLTGLFKQALKSELDTVWTAVCAGLPSDHPLYGSTSAVADALELEPTSDVMRERKPDWPLLCVHRTEQATYERDSFGNVTRKQTWNAHLILGPRAGIASDRKLQAVLIRASDILALVVERRGHPDYASGALQFFGSTLDGPHYLDSCYVVSSGVGNASFADQDAVYHAMRMVLETTEGSDDTLAAYPEFQGGTIHIGTGDASGVLPEVVELDTDHIEPMYSDP
jgi:hypothetical protein